MQVVRLRVTTLSPSWSTPLKNCYYSITKYFLPLDWLSVGQLPTHQAEKRTIDYSYNELENVGLSVTGLQQDKNFLLDITTYFWLPNSDIF